MKSKNTNLFSCAVLALALLTGCASGYKSESTGQYVDSSVITTTIKTKLLSDETVNGMPITVKTYKNTVQISGFVNTYAQKERAEEIAKNVQGVHSVVNSIVVKIK